MENKFALMCAFSIAVGLLSFFDLGNDLVVAFFQKIMISGEAPKVENKLKGTYYCCHEGWHKAKPTRAL